MSKTYLRLDLVGIQRRLACIPHAHWRGINNDVEIEPLEVRALHGARFRLPCQLLRGGEVAVQNGESAPHAPSAQRQPHELHRPRPRQGPSRRSSVMRCSRGRTTPEVSVLKP